MKRSALVLALAPLLLLFALRAAGDEDPEECQRYSAEEFKTTMFQRVVGMNLHLLRETLFQGTDGILELLDGVGDRNPGDEVVPRVKEVVKKIKPETTKIFMELFMAYEKKWAKVLEEAEGGGQQSFEDIRLKLQRIHTMMFTTHAVLHDVFETLTFAAKTVLDPMVEILTMFLKQSVDPKEKNSEMLDKLQEKNKLWGLVLGRVIQAKLEKEEVPSPDFMFRGNDMFSHFTSMFYTEGLDKEHAGRLDQEEFWKETLEKMWAYDWDEKYCEREGLGEKGEECDMNFMVETLVACLMSTPEGAEEDFWKREDHFDREPFDFRDPAEMKEK